MCETLDYNKFLIKLHVFQQTPTFENIVVAKYFYGQKAVGIAVGGVCSSFSFFQIVDNIVCSIHSSFKTSFDGLTLTSIFFEVCQIDRDLTESN